VLISGLLLILGTPLVDLIHPNPVPKPIGAEKVADDLMRAEANLWDRSWARLVEHDYRLRSRVRAFTSKYYTKALFLYLREASEQVVLGEDYWVFVENRTEPPQDDHEMTTGAAAAILCAIDRRLHSLGTKHFLVPVPRKAALYPERLPDHIAPDPDFDWALLQSLRERGLSPIDICEAYRRHEGEPLYVPYGSHWSPLAEKIAAEEIARQSGLLVPEDERQTRLVSTGRRHNPRELSLLGTIGVTLEGEELDRVRGEAPSTFFVVGRGDGGARQILSRDSNAEANFALCGTSFSARRDLPRFLAHYLDARVSNQALPGGVFQESIRNLLRKCSRESLPEVLIQELPVHHVFDPARTRVLSEVLAEVFLENPPEETLVLARGTHFLRDPEKVNAKGLASGRRLLASVPSGRIGHTGTGVVSLRLRSRHPERPGALIISSGGFTAPITWKAGTHELVFPLLDSRVAAGPISVLSESGPDARFELESLDFVGEFSTAGAVSCTPGAMEELDAPDGGWVQSLESPESQVLPRLGAIVIRCSSEAIPSRLRVTLECEDDQERVLTFADLCPGAVLVIDPGYLAGKVLEQVHVRGEGPVPGPVVRSARLVRPLHE